MNKRKSFLIALTVLLAMASVAVASVSAETDFDKCGKFNDVSPVNSFCGITRLMRDYHVFTGDDKSNFRPLDKVSRAEFAKILVVARYGDIAIEDWTKLDGATLGFKDLSGFHWSYPYIKIAKEKGLVNGYKDGTFRLGNTLTRAEFAKLLYVGLPDIAVKVAGAKTALKSGEAKDLISSQWYYDYMLLLNFANNTASVDPTLTGASLEVCGVNKLCPERTISRLEIAGALEKFHSVFGQTIGYLDVPVVVEPVVPDITNVVSVENCNKIKSLSDMTATLIQLNIDLSILNKCANPF